MGKSTKKRAGTPRGEGVSAASAVDAARRYFTEVAHIPLKDASVEEIELDEAGEHWWITLGYIEPLRGNAMTLTGKKSYKSFKVDAATGEVLAMKIREV